MRRRSSGRGGSRHRHRWLPHRSSNRSGRDEHRVPGPTPAAPPLGCTEGPVRTGDLAGPDRAETLRARSLPGRGADAPEHRPDLRFRHRRHRVVAEHGAHRGHRCARTAGGTPGRTAPPPVRGAGPRDCRGTGPLPPTRGATPRRQTRQHPGRPLPVHCAIRAGRLRHRAGLHRPQDDPVRNRSGHRRLLLSGTARRSASRRQLRPVLPRRHHGASAQRTAALRHGRSRHHRTPTADGAATAALGAASGSAA